ncbi:MAG: DUF3616 domain-containing protein [Pseudomonadota bacterium]
MAEKLGEIILRFRDAAQIAHVTDPIAEDLSAVARAGDALFLSCDETAGIDRLVEGPAGTWAMHEHIGLGEIFDQPDGPEGEADIEGLAVSEDADGPWLWIAGSHALKRRKAKRAEHDAEKAAKRLRKIEREANRYLLGRVPLAPAADGGLMPVARHRDRTAAALPFSGKKSALMEALEDDPLLAPFLDIPSKENGFDAEGLAASGQRVWLGLRGPVIAGHAVVIEMAVEAEPAGELKPRKLDGDRRYRLHLLPSGGLGIRDMTVLGEDLVLLTGPVLGGDGPAHVLRWRGALAAEGGVVAEGALQPLGEVPYRGPVDHPEGLLPWPEAGEGAWLLVNDAPAPERLCADGLSVTADILRLGHG